MSGWLPESLSTHGQDPGGLFVVIYTITTLSSLLVLATMVRLLIGHRQRQKSPTASLRGNNTLELSWILVPAVVFVALGLISLRTWATDRRPAPEPGLEVEVVSSRPSSPDGVGDQVARHRNPETRPAPSQ